MISYGLLFLSAFLAATLLPFYSEVVLVTLLLEGKPVFGLWLAATVGNTLGAAVNWAMGRYLLHFQDRRWFPFKVDKLHRAQAWFQRYGSWSLLLAWLPVGGDALTFIAGIMRVRLWVLLLLSGIGKGLRYAVVIWLTGATSNAVGPQTGAPEAAPLVPGAAAAVILLPVTVGSSGWQHWVAEQNRAEALCFI
ncbi:MAG: hypothetical protein CML06_11005 [Pseudomonadales bacterium]|nr:hypothetical protein [Pseudomonadales bacterium]